MKRIVHRIWIEFSILVMSCIMGGLFGWFGGGVVLIADSMLTGKPIQELSSTGWWVAVGIGAIVMWSLMHPDVVTFRRSHEPDWLNDHL